MAHAVQVHRAQVRGEAAAQRRIRVQFAGLEQRPHLLAVPAVQQLRGEAAEAGGEVVDVAQQHRARGVVAAGTDHLREIDHHRTVGADQHVVGRQVAVDQAAAQHQLNLAHQHLVVDAGLVGFQLDLAQARGAEAVGVGDQFHHQHAMEKAERLRHAHPGFAQLVQRLDLGVLPGLFLLLAPVLAGLADRARLATAAHLASFLVLHALLETALGHVLVHLGAAHLATAAHDVDRRLLAALEWAQHFVDDAVVDQRLQAWGCSHGIPETGGGVGRSRGAAMVAPPVPPRICQNRPAATTTTAPTDDCTRIAPPDPVRQPDRHHHRVLRFLHLRHRRGAGVPAAVLPGFRAHRRDPAVAGHLRPGVLRPAAGLGAVRPLRRPGRAQGHPGGGAADHGHLHRADRPAADPCADRRGRAGAAGAVPFRPGPGPGWGVGRCGAAGHRERAAGQARLVRHVPAAGRAAGLPVFDRGVPAAGAFP